MIQCFLLPLMSLPSFIFIYSLNYPPFRMTLIGHVFLTLLNTNFYKAVHSFILSISSFSYVTVSYMSVWSLIHHSCSRDINLKSNQKLTTKRPKNNWITAPNLVVCMNWVSAGNFYIFGATFPFSHAPHARVKKEQATESHRRESSNPPLSLPLGFLSTQTEAPWFTDNFRTKFCGGTFLKVMPSG